MHKCEKISEWSSKFLEWSWSKLFFSCELAMMTWKLSSDGWYVGMSKSKSSRFVSSCWWKVGGAGGLGRLTYTSSLFNIFIWFKLGCLILNLLVSSSSPWTPIASCNWIFVIITPYRITKFYPFDGLSCVKSHHQPNWLWHFLEEEEIIQQHLFWTMEPE